MGCCVSNGVQTATDPKSKQTTNDAADGVVSGRISGADVIAPASVTDKPTDSKASVTHTHGHGGSGSGSGSGNGSHTTSSDAVPPLRMAGIGIELTDGSSASAAPSTPTSASVADASHGPNALSQSFFNRVFARYVPFAIRDRFELDPNPLNHTAELERFEGAVAFVDISGFTKLSEWLVVKHGRDIAAEKLNLYISGYFDRLLDVIIEHGGDVLKFAGDAMLVCWRLPRKSAKPAETTPVPWKPNFGGSMITSGVGSGGAPTKAGKFELTASSLHAAGGGKSEDNKTLTTAPAAPPLDPNATPPPAASATYKKKEPLPDGQFAHTYQSNPQLAQLVYKAAACNLALLQQHNNFRPTGTAEINLTLHTGLGCGELSGLYVGGVDGMWEYFIGGEPIHQMSEAGEVAASGEVMLSPQCYELVKGWVTAGHTHAKSKNFSLAGLAVPDCDPMVLAYGFAPPPPAGPDTGFVFTPPLVTEREEIALEHFIPPIVKKRMLAGQDSIWLSEFRKVCILFVALPGYEWIKCAFPLRFVSLV